MGKISFRSFFFAAILIWSLSFDVICGGDYQSFRPLVTREERRTIVSGEYGEITAVDLHDGFGGAYHLQFFTMDTSTLLLPLLLHTDMVFYVLTGKGSVSWIGEDGTDSIEVKAGDIYRLEGGTVFYVRSYPDSTRVKLRIHAIFDTVGNQYPSLSSVGVYSNVSDLVRGFDDVILQMGFGVPEDVIQGIKGAEQPPPIVRFKPNSTEIEEANWKEEGIIEALFGGSRHKISLVNGKKKKKKKKKEEKTMTFNIFDSKPDVENCNGKSIEVTSKKLKSLKGSEIGMFMVNLTKGSMMGPHWNPMATEIAMVVHGRGMVQVVCPVKPSGVENNTCKCENITITVGEGDVFIVQRYHPMVQISFNNDSFVFMGFSTMASKNHPQFLAGKRSVLRTIDREILATSFNVANTTIDEFLDSQVESIMFECTSCAEELERKMQKEIERKRQEEEARKKEEEEARRGEEEERKREEEEDRKREEEEARKREEEEERRREEEEAREREEEEARKKQEEEEERRREEEEARRKQEEEEERKREEEEARRKEEEEDARRREEEEEEARREKEEEARRREEKEEEARRREEEEARKREEEEARRREEEEEEARRREEGEQKQREREEEERRQEEEAQVQERGQPVKGVEGETSKKVRMIWRV